MARTLLFTTTASAVTAGSGGNTFTITDPSVFKSLRVEFTSDGDSLLLMRLKYDGVTYEAYRDENGTYVTMSNKRPSVIPIEIGTYALEGTVAGTVTAYTDEV